MYLCDCDCFYLYFMHSFALAANEDRLMKYVQFNSVSDDVYQSDIWHRKTADIILSYGEKHILIS